MKTIRETAVKISVGLALKGLHGCTHKSRGLPTYPPSHAFFTLIFLAQRLSTERLSAVRVR